MSVITGGIYQLAGLFIAKKAKSFNKLQEIGNVTNRATQLAKNKAVGEAAEAQRLKT
ncbi:hypothetical protein A0J47_020225 (plasmid) [Photobacterium damselae subsp. damselae]|uniref:Uncharacterized protein n=1 Tax=Photobacterium damselae subsp. damselae TaxID=85581 RepID=E4WLC2_PHODD|nr:hypothetical protein [Photobacterium damselae]QSH59600.1 hypothetical protein A0J47_020225 [Photobacterium damselae subsp. damselae]CBX86840.1 hypothetical protein [Photobacterium damselae subsp. damselae]